MKRRSTRKSSASAFLSSPAPPPFSTKDVAAKSPKISPTVQFEFNLNGFNGIGTSSRIINNKGSGAGATTSKLVKTSGISTSPQRSLKSASSISDLKDMASSNLESIKRHLKRSHSKIYKDVEASECRLQKRFKTPCGHNFCLKCFEKWIKQGKHTYIKCRRSIPQKMADHPRINSSLVITIRMAKLSRLIMFGGPKFFYRFLHNQDRPYRAFTSERAQKPGMANASSGRIFVTLPKDHFGPIPAENDPERHQGFLVGETWAMCMECRQWGVHYPPLAGIVRRARYGAQSILILGGYEEDEDKGEGFIYTGSGGRDLTGNKHTNKKQSYDQEFTYQNQALRVSCIKGYPVRVVR